MSDPAVTRIPAVDSREPLVDLEASGIMRFSDRKRGSNQRIAFVREGVAARIGHAAGTLPSDVRLLGVEAYRPAALQQHYYSHYEESLRSENPGLPDDELAVLVSRFVSPPEIAPHPSGAAIDLTLCDASGQELDLGCAVDATPEASDGACFTDAIGLTPEASANRRLLVDALSSAGLVNYPTEWWHWSFGDRYWAMSVGADRAMYGPVVAV